MDVDQDAINSEARRAEKRKKASDHNGVENGSRQNKKKSRPSTPSQVWQFPPPLMQLKSCAPIVLVSASDQC